METWREFDTPGDHRAALAALGKERIAELARLSDGPGLVRIAVQLGTLVLTGWAVLAAEGLWRLPFQVIHGVVLTFLFCTLHETIHGTAFRTKRLNEAVAAVTGFLSFQPPKRFRFFHFAHHRHTQDRTRDPELASPKPRTRLAYLIHLTGWHHWAGQIPLLFSTAFARDLPDYVPPRASGPVRREARLFLVLYGAIGVVSIAAGSSLVLTLWIVPALLGQPFMRAFLLAEHTGCPLVPDMLSNSRTTFCHRAIRWLAWEMPWHTAHHAAPTVPFHRLSQMSAEIESALKHTADGYLDVQRQVLRAIDARDQTIMDAGPPSA